jgi:hypothetical protein
LLRVISASDEDNRILVGHVEDVGNSIHDTAPVQVVTISTFWLSSVIASSLELVGEQDNEETREGVGVGGT